MKAGNARGQRGVVLIALLAVVALGASWFLVSRLNAESAVVTAATRSRNAEVLNRAKQALIGWVAIQAATAGEDNPGRLPCPEHPWYIGNNSKEGIMGPSVGVSNPGVGAPNSNCTMIGRLPWRSLGIDKLVDASGEPLWYVVSPAAWALQSSLTVLTINSNTLGQLTVDGQPNAAVGLIIAPGRAMDVQASAGCAARTQSRSAPSPGINALDYLECYNAATSSFTTSGPSNSFNDQVLRVTTADILPALEAAIANRIERETAPKLKQVYTTTNGWTLSPGVALPAGTALFPFAVSFADPESTPDPDTSGYPDRNVYKGAVGTYVGLAPLARQVPGSVAWINPATGFTLNILGGGILASATDCSTSTTSVFRCTLDFLLASGFTLDVDASNVGTGFRDAPGVAANLLVTNGTGTVSNSLRSDGSARTRIEVTPSLPAGIVTVQLTINAGDSIIDNIATNSTYSWYFRNGWHKLSLYVVSQGFAPGAVGACGSPNPVCLTINDVIYPATGKYAALILAGRALSGQARPNATLANYLEGENLLPLDETLRRGGASRTINDRVVIVAP